MIVLMTSSDLASWLEALGTVATATIALYLLGREQVDRRNQARDRRAEQAAQVRLTAPVKGGGSGVKHSYFDKAATTTVYNSSGDVVSEVIVEVRISTLDGASEQGLPRTVTKVLKRLEPGQKANISASTRVNWPVGSDPIEVEFESHVTFYDVAGRRWERDSDHRLREIKPPGLLARLRTRRRRERLDSRKRTAMPLESFPDEQ
ncbi:hypothetical protein [Kribbella sp. CA-293567]|uniref:hypothetical protein n=1 Tax=Kribbella sp. CA-293567 TaxID=3002436 RepID=UPI0022DD59D7|nr:hypothetical protein [Kribbella sp. CA-293567]WBQ03231.1 hypothetical protein OX958_25000 [Kribbella sp. CA-293567]